MLLTTTLTSAAAAAIINIWLGMRCGQIRTKDSISIGHGGSEMLERRMRAQLNFAENTPWVLALIAALELAGKGGQWLPYVAGIYMLGRLAHAMGMDGTSLAKGRMIGTITTMLTQLGLAIVAALVATGTI